MLTQLLEKDNIERIVKILEEDGIVAIPTDTVYGLAIKSDSEALYKKLVRVKGRPEDKPFPLMVSSTQQLNQLVDMDPMTQHMVKHFMPGAITFIFKKKPSVFPFLKNQDTLGIRMADDLWVHSIIEKLGAPLWLPSANKSGDPTGTSSDEVYKNLKDEIEGIVIGESLKKTSSTVVDLSVFPYKILREGPITKEDIENQVKKYLENIE